MMLKQKRNIIINVNKNFAFCICLLKASMPIKKVKGHMLQIQWQQEITMMTTKEKKDNDEREEQWQDIRTIMTRDKNNDDKR